MPNPSRETLRAHAAAILADPPPLTEWAAGGDQGWPDARVLSQAINKVGWPKRTVEVDLPQREHTGVRAGQVTGTARQSIVVVPMSWLEELARQLGVPLSSVCRGRIE